MVTGRESRDKPFATLIFDLGSFQQRLQDIFLKKDLMTVYISILSAQKSRWLKVELWPSPRAILQNFATLVERYCSSHVFSAQRSKSFELPPFFCIVSVLLRDCLALPSRHYEVEATLEIS